MNKEEVVELMSNYIEEINRKLGSEMMMNSAQIEQAISAARPQLKEMNGALYDLLLNYGIIQR